MIKESNFTRCALFHAMKPSKTLRSQRMKITSKSSLVATIYSNRKALSSWNCHEICGNGNRKELIANNKYAWMLKFNCYKEKVTMLSSKMTKRSIYTNSSIISGDYRDIKNTIKSTNIRNKNIHANTIYSRRNNAAAYKAIGYRDLSTSSNSFSTGKDDNPKHLKLSESDIDQHVRNSNTSHVNTKEFNNSNDNRNDFAPAIRGSEFSVVFLGTGSGIPNTRRMCSCTYLRLGSQSYMFDAGESASTQSLISDCVVLTDIKKIFITHLHADHILGLPGLLLSIHYHTKNKKARKKKKKHSRGKTVKNDNNTTLEIYGPPGLYNFIITNLSFTSANLDPSFKVMVYELIGGGATTMTSYRNEKRNFINNFKFPKQFLWQNNILHRYKTCSDDGTWTLHDAKEEKLTEEQIVTSHRNSVRKDPVKIYASEIYHVPSMQTFGYVIQEYDPLPTLNHERASALGITNVKKYQLLKQGFSVLDDVEKKRLIHPSQVLDKNKKNFKSRKLAVLGDTCSATPQMAKLCRNADIVVHEATLSERDLPKSINRGHSTPSMAGRFADSVDATLLILNHQGGAYRRSHDHFNRDTYEEDDEYDKKKKSSNIINDAQAVIQGNTKVLCAYDFMEIQVPRTGFLSSQSMEEMKNNKIQPKKIVVSTGKEEKEKDVNNDSQFENLKKILTKNFFKF